MTFAELPEEWQKKIQALQGENRNLHRLNGLDVKFEDLPPSWQSKLDDLRKESAKLRIQRNEARAELAALRAERV